MTGFSKLNAVFHCFLVTNLTDQDHVRCLSQSVFQGRMPGISVDTDFALSNYASLMRMNVFDRVLNRNDMALGVRVAVPDHCSKRCRLTRTGSANNDDQAALVHDNVLENRRQIQLAKRRNLGRNRS